MPQKEDRLDPSLVNRELLDQVVQIMTQGDRPALVGREGVRIELPDPIFHALVRIVREMQQGRAVVVMPEDETFTTQAAADFLGMSRQHLVDLIEKNEIPHYRVGAHRRVTLKDLRAYQEVRDKNRRQALSRLFKKLKDEGQYDADYTGDAG